MIFQPKSARGEQSQQPWLLYVTPFEKIHVTEHTGLQRLQRKSNGHNGAENFGTVVEMIRVRKPVDVTPYFGEAAHPELTCENSMEISNQFLLNHCDIEDDFIFNH